VAPRANRELVASLEDSRLKLHLYGKKKRRGTAENGASHGDRGFGERSVRRVTRRGVVFEDERAAPLPPIEPEG